MLTKLWNADLKAIALCNIEDLMGDAAAALGNTPSMK